MSVFIDSEKKRLPTTYIAVEFNFHSNHMVYILTLMNLDMFKNKEYALKDSDDTSVTFVTLRSSDDILCKVPLHVAKQMGIISIMIDDIGLTYLKEENVIPLFNVRSEILFDVIQLLSSPHENVKYLSTLSHDKIKEVANAVNYLQIDTLLDNICVHIRNMIEKMSQEQVNDFLNPQPIS